MSLVTIEGVDKIYTDGQVSITAIPSPISDYRILDFTIYK